MTEPGASEVVSGEQADATKDIVGKLDALGGKVDALASENAALKQQLADSSGELTSEEYLNFLASRKTPTPSKGGEEQGEVPDLDTMTGSELAEHIAGMSKKELASAMAEMKSERDTLTKQLGTTFAQVDLQLTRLRHKDLDAGMDNKEYRDAFIGVAKDNPGWDANRVYKELKRNIREKEDEAAATAKAKEKLALDVATERGTIPGPTMAGKAISLAEAAEMAARKHLG